MRYNFLVTIPSLFPPSSQPQTALSRPFFRVVFSVTNKSCVCYDLGFLLFLLLLGHGYMSPSNNMQPVRMTTTCTFVEDSVPVF